MTEPVRSRRAGRAHVRLAAPSFETVMLAMSSGLKLAIEIREPRGRAVGTAILLHPMMASRRVWNTPREQGFAAELNESGLRTLALDFRGHGESRPGAVQGGSFRFDQLVNEDIPAICHAARERWPAERIALVGHSMGGSAAMAAVATGTCSPDALVAIATNVWMPSEEPNPILRAKKAALLRTCGALSRAVGYFPARALGVGSDDVPLLFMESLVDWWLHDRWTSDDGAIDYAGAMARISIPTLGIASLGDRLLCTPASAARFLKRLRGAHATFELVRQADDGGPAPDHLQIVTTRAAASYWQRIAAFCAGR